MKMSYPRSIQPTRVYISPYQLKLQKEGMKPLQGVLLLFEFESGLKGYSDFLPWPQFGEPSLWKQLEDVKNGWESARWICAKNTALVEALARKEKRNLFFGLNIPKSHFLIEDILSFSSWRLLEKAEFNTVKIKLNKQEIQKALPQIKKVHIRYPHLKWRLDFNGSLKVHQWSALKESLEFLWNQIDFIEDPFQNFQRISESTNNLFAEDWISNPHATFRIVKPSKDSLYSLTKQMLLCQWKGIVFTHSQETLLGQAATAYWAGEFYKIHPSYSQTGAFKSFSLKQNRWTFHEDKSPVFKPPSGWGLGFGDLLKKEPWKRWI